MLLWIQVIPLAIAAGAAIAGGIAGAAKKKREAAERRKAARQQAASAILGERPDIGQAQSVYTGMAMQDAQAQLRGLQETRELSNAGKFERVRPDNTATAWSPIGAEWANKSVQPTAYDALMTSRKAPTEIAPELEEAAAAAQVTPEEAAAIEDRADAQTEATLSEMRAASDAIDDEDEISKEIEATEAERRRRWEADLIGY